MHDDITFRDLFPYVQRDRKLLAAFLQDNALRFEEDIEGVVAAFAEETLVACGCFSGNILKCFAVSEAARGRNLLGAIIPRLVSKQYERGVYQLFVYTKPDNCEVFEACGFFPVCATQDAALLENRKNGVEDFARTQMTPADAGIPSGAVVMNCNPFTRGHRFLIEHAAQRCALLHVFVVQEDRSLFPFAARMKLVLQGVADIGNVRVVAGGPYTISASTFPSYFLKQASDAARVQAELDVTLFASRIAPLFTITRRFAGTEPACPLTRQYNDAMRRILPAHGLEFEEVPRLLEGGEAVSASRVRQHIGRWGVTPDLAAFVPETTLRFLQGPEAVPIIRKLREEYAPEG